VWRHTPDKSMSWLTTFSSGYTWHTSFLVPLTGQWLNFCASRWDSWGADKLDPPLCTLAVVMSTFWTSSWISFVLNCLWLSSPPQDLWSRNVLSTEIQKVEEQLFRPFPCMTTYAIAVWHSVTFVNIPHMCVILLDNMKFYGIPIQVSKIAIGWRRVYVREHVYLPLVFPAHGR
jgi:hypothetical protein